MAWQAVDYEGTENYHQTIKKQLYKRSLLNHNQQYHAKYNANKTVLRKCLKETEMMYYN